jgi:D-threo-aldose 1-dehydrogenase
MGYDPAATRKLGSAPLEVTQLGLGCGPIGGFRVAIPEDEALGLVTTAHEAGIRLFDTSPLYGHGRSASCGSARRCASCHARASSSRPRSAAG